MEGTGRLETHIQLVRAPNRRNETYRPQENGYAHKDSAWSKMKTKMEMSSKYLPRDRRFLQERMVDKSQANLFAVCVKLKLFPVHVVNRGAMLEFARKLYIIVAKRHTHLWDKGSTSFPGVNQHKGLRPLEEARLCSPEKIG